MPQRVERAQHNPAQNAFVALLHQGFDGAGAALRIPVDQQTSKIERSQGFQFKPHPQPPSTYVNISPSNRLTTLTQLGGKIGIGGNITQVQKVFKGVFNLEPGFKQDGSQFDHLLQEGEVIPLGELSGEVMFVPGHTPACAAYRFGDAVFVGDTLFMPDVGTARCDFPGGDARQLYASTRKLLGLPPATRLFMCHDYPPADRPVRFETTVAEQRAKNIHVNDGVSEDEFVAMRTQRDATLEMPTLILPAVQINIRAGELPPKEDNGVAYLKIPLNAL